MSAGPHAGFFNASEAYTELALARFYQARKEGYAGHLQPIINALEAALSSMRITDDIWKEEMQRG